MSEDKTLQTFLLDNPIRKLIENEKYLSKFIKQGMKVADIGCGPGFYAVKLSKLFGDEGIVYASDADENNDQQVKKKFNLNNL